VARRAAANTLTAECIECNLKPYLLSELLFMLLYVIVSGTECRAEASLVSADKEADN